MRALRYFTVEAAASLWRGRKGAVLAILTIAGGLFVLGFFLVLNTNLQRLVGRWGDSAELSVYLKDDVTRDQLRTIDDLVGGSGLAAHREYVSKDQAAARFRQDFPDLAGSSERLDANPFPASFEVRLEREVGESGAATDQLAATLGGMAGVADVRYDRRWLVRLNRVVEFLRGFGLLVIAVLAVASALTVANVVRLAASARQDEIEIMELVGAPLAYVRGPFVMEGILQGGSGALLAILLLWGLFAAARARYGQFAADAIGLGSITFLPVGLCVVIIGGGMLLGCIGGLIVARGVR
ncbi:MAG: ABC transporter permease [Acidobacteriota bacterium]